MSCPKCGNEIIGVFCSDCGYQINKSSTEYSSPTNQQISPSQTSTPYQQPQININISNDQQYIQPSPHPDWYKDGSIMGLFLVVISGIIVWYYSMLFGLLLGLISLIIAARSKKRQGRIPIFSIIFTVIAFVVEIILVGLTLYAAVMSGLI